MMFKKNDKVWSVDSGWGVIESITLAEDYPVRVSFEHGDEVYTLKGEYLIDCNQSLFFEEFEIPKSARERPFTPKRGEWVAARGIENWYIVKFDCILTSGNFKDTEGKAWLQIKSLEDFTSENKNCK